MSVRATSARRRVPRWLHACYEPSGSETSTVPLPLHSGHSVPSLALPLPPHIVHVSLATASVSSSCVTVRPRGLYRDRSPGLRFVVLSGGTLLLGTLCLLLGGKALPLRPRGLLLSLEPGLLGASTARAASSRCAAAAVRRWSSFSARCRRAATRATSAMSTTTTTAMTTTVPLDMRNGMCQPLSAICLSITVVEPWRRRLGSAAHHVAPDEQRQRDDRGTTRISISMSFPFSR